MLNYNVFDIDPSLETRFAHVWLENLLNLQVLSEIFIGLGVAVTEVLDDLLEFLFWHRARIVDNLV